MNDIRDITLGEVYRKLEDMDERHTRDLGELVTQTKLTNGRVNRHAVAIAVIQWAVALVGAVAVAALGVVLDKVFG